MVVVAMCLAFVLGLFLQSIVSPSGLNLLESVTDPLCFVLIVSALILGIVVFILMLTKHAKEE